jgi:hypothetical protein
MVKEMVLRNYIAHVTYRVFIIAGLNTAEVALGGLVVSVLATGPKVRGFDPDRGRWIFKGDKNP